MPQDLNLNTIINYVVLALIVKVFVDDWVVSILKWLGRIIKRLIKFLFRLTEKDIAVLLHAFKQRARLKHQHPNVVVCPDEKCSKIS